jgi:site-specific DNA recombinase
MTSAYSDDYPDDLDQDDAPVSPVTNAGIVAEPGTRAVIYLRVSSTGQVNTDYDPEGISIPAQRVACQRKAEQLGLTVIDEYIEPGKSATEMTKRLAFQQMLTRVRQTRDIDYVIVYKLSRMARNRYDDAIVMADLRKRGVTLISATESIDDTPVGQLMHGILATFNEYQSRESGADIAYKMGQKAKSGGTLGRAPLGYLNVFDRSEGREIRTVTIDPDRAKLIKLAFELYATGEYTLADLSDELYDRGLRSRPTALHPAKQVSINKLSLMLRDRYYLGLITYKDEEFEGRHDALIDEDLFGRVQDIIESRSTAKERRRVHHHYLKGSLFCGRCQQATGVTQRMIIQHTVNSRGSEYTYFFCRNKQNGNCPSPHVNVIRIEDAVEDHYATIRFSPEFIADVRTHLGQTLADQETATRLLKQQLTTQLHGLDAKEDNLIDLAADGTLPQAKIKQKLREIERERKHLTERLQATAEDLTDNARLIEACLTLLTNPQELYRRCDDEQRRLLNQAIFLKLYVDHDKITGHELHEPFARLHAVQEAHQATDGDKPDPGACSATQKGRRTAPHSGDGPSALLEGLLAGMDQVHCSSKPPRVELRGLEPLTPHCQNGRNESVCAGHSRGWR